MFQTRGLNSERASKSMRISVRGHKWSVLGIGLFKLLIDVQWLGRVARVPDDCEVRTDHARLDRLHLAQGNGLIHGGR